MEIKKKDKIEKSAAKRREFGESLIYILNLHAQGWKSRI